MRALVIEDNARLAELIAGALHGAGFGADTAGNAGGGRAALAAVAYDLVLLDLGLPDEQGVELLRDVRRHRKQTPCIIITARGTVADRIAGLDAGADDYLVKPFHMSELLARCRAVLRRPGARLGTVLRAGNIVLDTSAHEVRVAGRPLPLAKREIMILTLLLRRTGDVVERGVLEEAVGEFGREVTPNAIEAQVSRLRRRLAAAGATATIETARGVGYIIRKEPEAHDGGT